MKVPPTKKTTDSSTHSSTPFFRKDGKGRLLSQDSVPEAPFFPPKVQPKLKVGEAGDQYEQEADQVADQVVQKINTQAPTAQNSSASTASPNIQRKPMFETEKEGEDKLQKKEKDSSPRIMRKQATSGGDEGAPNNIESQLNTSKGSGQTLPKDTKSSMESAFSRDFSQVKVHTGNSAIQMNQDLNAKAFTHGSDIYFNKNEYNPSSASGQKLLAHELTHTVQQGHAAATPNIQRFEAAHHEKIERVGLTTNEKGEQDGLTNEEASAVYFGNWMRDFNQALVPLVKDAVDTDLLFAGLNLVAANKFGRLMTPEQFGFYIPSEHLDNPAGLVNQDDLLSNQPDIENLIGPDNAQERPSKFDTPQESMSPNSKAVAGSPAELFDVDQSGVMAFMRRTNVHVEKRLELAAESGRNPEGMMHFGAGLHAVEDLFAHSNWIEIAVEKILKEDSSLLCGTPDNPYDYSEIFNYSRDIDVKKGEKKGVPSVESRPVLTTGSFTGGDSAISILSEAVKFLRTPLQRKKWDSKSKAAQLEKQFMTALLEKAGYDVIALIYKHVPSLIIPAILPQAVYDAANTEMSAIADRLEAEAINMGVADTSLINAYEDQKKIASSDFSADPTVMERLGEEIGGTSVRDQRRGKVAVADRHVKALDKTPEAVLAGPSHSQIAKDHSNSPFFGIGFNLATHAVRMLRVKMIDAWGEKKSFDFKKFEGASEEDKELYNSKRHGYKGNKNAPSYLQHKENKSLEDGMSIINLGGDKGEHGHFHPYDLQSTRNESARRIRLIADVLKSIDEAPGKTKKATRLLEEEISGIASNSKALEHFKQKSGEMLSKLEWASYEVDKELDLLGIITELNKIAGEIKVTKKHGDREELNNRLLSVRNKLIKDFSSNYSTWMLERNLRLSLFILINDEISKTAVSYTGNQKEILESDASKKIEGHKGAQELKSSTVNLPNLSTKSKKVRSLLEESRMILGHPYDSDWWVGHVKDYITNHPEQIKADIEARNGGYATFDGGHKH